MKAADQLMGRLGSNMKESMGAGSGATGAGFQNASIQMRATTRSVSRLATSATAMIAYSPAESPALISPGLAKNPAIGGMPAREKAETMYSRFRPGCERYKPPSSASIELPPRRQTAPAIRNRLVSTMTSSTT